MPTLPRRTDEVNVSSLPWPTRWRLLRDGAYAGLPNMQRDLALLHVASESGDAFLRTYGWKAPTVSFGRNEAVRDVWDIAAMRAAGHDVVRRPTGGRALLHGHEFTWSVAMPADRSVPWRLLYDQVSERLCEALRGLGIAAERWREPELAGSHGSQRHAAGTVCFARPSAGELVVGAAKIGASSVWRTTSAYLQHGSILLRDSQHTLGAFRRSRAATGATRERGDIELSDQIPAAACVETLLASDAGLHALREQLRHSVENAWRQTASDLADVASYPGWNEQFATACSRAAETVNAENWLWRR